MVVEKEEEETAPLAVQRWRAQVVRGAITHDSGIVQKKSDLSHVQSLFVI